MFSKYTGPFSQKHTNFTCFHLYISLNVSHVWFPSVAFVVTLVLTLIFVVCFIVQLRFYSCPPNRWWYEGPFAMVSLSHHKPRSVGQYHYNLIAVIILSVFHIFQLWVCVLHLTVVGIELWLWVQFHTQLDMTDVEDFDYMGRGTKSPCQRQWWMQHHSSETTTGGSSLNRWPDRSEWPYRSSRCNLWPMRGQRFIPVRYGRMKWGTLDWVGYHGVNTVR